MADGGEVEVFEGVPFIPDAENARPRVRVIPLWQQISDRDRFLLVLGGIMVILSLVSTFSMLWDMTTLQGDNHADEYMTMYPSHVYEPESFPFSEKRAKWVMMS
mmetsp:Transcript_20538/g.47490  ORF Transcript_20538/g.47490 Transcript_20538/m.47490 type:complete len:104 (-) Transcript_20538:72-383(-)